MTTKVMAETQAAVTILKTEIDAKREAPDAAAAV